MITIQQNDRSLTACMHEAIDTAQKEWRQILRASWPAVLVMTIFATTTLLFRLPNKSLHDWGLTAPTASFIIQTIVYTGTILAAFFYEASVFHLFRSGSRRATLWRTTKMMVLTLTLTGVIFFLAFWGFKESSIFLVNHIQQPAAIIIISSVAIVLLAVVLFLIVPFSYVYTRYILDNQVKLKNYWSLWRTGLRRWGLLFIAWILVTLLLTVTTALTFLPANILITAQTISQLGALDGDSLGTPAYFPIFVIVFSAIAFFCFFYLAMIAHFFLFNLTAAIDAHEKGKREMTEAEKEEVEEEKIELENIKI